MLTSEGIGRGTATLAELGRARLVGSLPALPGAGETGDWALARNQKDNMPRKYVAGAV